MTLLEGASRAQEVPGLPKAGAKGLLDFALLIQRFSARASQVNVGVLLEELVEELELLRILRDEGPDGDDRAENVKELIAGALDFDAELLEEELAALPAVLLVLVGLIPLVVVNRSLEQSH